MKKLFTLFTAVILSIVGLCQSDSLSLPRYYVINNDTVGLIISVEQAQKIDNDLEIKNLLEQSLVDCDSLSMQYLVVMDDQQKQIALLEFKNLELLKATQQQTLLKEKLEAKIANYEKDLSLCDEQSKKKDIIIHNQHRTINGILIGGSVLQVLLTGLIGILILK